MRLGGKTIGTSVIGHALSSVDSAASVSGTGGRASTETMSVMFMADDTGTAGVLSHCWGKIASLGATVSQEVSLDASSTLGEGSGLNCFSCAWAGDGDLTLLSEERGKASV